MAKGWWKEIGSQDEIRIPTAGDVLVGACLVGATAALLPLGWGGGAVAVLLVAIVLRAWEDG